MHSYSSRTQVGLPHPKHSIRKTRIKNKISLLQPKILLNPGLDITNTSFHPNVIDKCQTFLAMFYINFALRLITD